MNSPIFLSHFLEDATPGYGGSQGFFSKPINQMSAGASSNSQEWRLSNHIGTHIDLPKHFDDAGRCLDDYSAADWVFHRPYLLNLPTTEKVIIGPTHDFLKIPLDADMVVLKTGFQKHRNSELYWSSNPGLSPELGAWFRRERPQVKILGFDFISITSYTNRSLGRIAHKEFLSQDSIGTPLRVIEDMKLDELHTSPKQVIVSPLLVSTADGSPVTVIAI